MLRKTLISILIFWGSLIYSQADRFIDSLIKLSASYHNTDTAVFFAKQALAIAEKNNNPKKIVAAHSALGGLEAKAGHYENAIRHFRYNFQKGLEQHNDKWVAGSQINIANIYLSRGDYEPAIKYYLAALKINEKGEDQGILRVNYLCLGIAYYYYKNYPLSLNYYEKTLALDLKLGELARAAYPYNAIGVIYRETGDYKKALDYLQKTEDIARTYHDTTILSHNRANLGEVYGLNGNYEKALYYLQSAIELQKGMGDKKGMAESIVLLGNVNKDHENYKQAIKNYNDALVTANEIGIKEIQKNCYKGLSETYSGLRQYEKALRFQSRYAGIKDTLFDESSAKQVTEMQTRYETEKKEKENLLLTSQNRISALEISRQKTQRNIIIILFVLIISLIGILYNRNRLKQKNRLLAEKDLRNTAVFKAQEDEKTRLSQELHDGVGPLLALIKLNVSSLETNEANRQMITDTIALASEGIKEVRDISHILMPALLEKKGLRPALEDFIAQVNQSLKVDFRYEITGELFSLTQVNLYRIVQEALNNIIKHAHATLVQINLMQNPGGIELQISDNGKGFDVHNTTNGNGLNNIYSRVDFLKGVISYKSNAQQGTHIKITVPINQE